MTDFLQFLSNKVNLFNPISPLLAEVLKKSHTQTIIDLGSGGGGGLLSLNDELRKEIPNLTIVLTDYYPNLKAFEFTKKQSDNFDYIKESVDAMDVPADLQGVRTLFLALHHFKPQDARSILQNAVDEDASIAIFEGQERSLPSLFGMFISPLTLLLTTPFIRPFRWGRIVFTYLIPLVPLFTWWDGIVSSLRTYSIKEMKELVAQINHSHTYDWQIGKKKSGPVVILYLIGVKK